VCSSSLGNTYLDLDYVDVRSGQTCAGARVKKMIMIIERFSITFNGKCGRQKYHEIVSFPPFFTFAVCRFQREEACSRSHQQHKHFFKVFDSLCYNYQPVLKPSDVLFIFYAN